jgi:hypothetical protein
MIGPDLWRHKLEAISLQPGGLQEQVFPQEINHKNKNSQKKSQEQHVPNG